MGAQQKKGIDTIKIALSIVIIVLTIFSISLYYLNTNLNNQLLQLQTSYNDLLASYNNLQTSFNNLQSSYTILQTQKNNLQTSYNNLQTDFNTLQINYNNLQTNYDTLAENYSSFLYNLTNGIRIDSITRNKGVLSQSGVTSVTIRNLGTEEVHVISLKLYYNNILQSSASVSVTIYGNSTATISTFLPPSSYSYNYLYFLKIETLEGFSTTSDPLPLCQ